MADIANLTVKYQSEGYDKVSKEVDSLTAAGTKVEEGFNKIASSSKQVGAASSEVNKLTDSGKRMGASADLAANSLLKWVERLDAANARFGKTNLELLKMSSAFDKLTADQQAYATQVTRVADALASVGSLLTPAQTASQRYGSAIGELNVLLEAGRINQAQFASAMTAASREYDVNSGAISRAQAAYRELIAAQEQEVAASRAVAESAAREAAAQRQREAAVIASARASQLAANSQRTISGLVGGPPDEFRSAQLAAMRADAMAVWPAFEKSGTTAIGRIETKIGGLRSSIIGLAGVFEHAIGGLIAFAALGAFAEFVRSIGDANVNMQRMLNTLNSATGSMQAAHSEFAFLSQTANRLGTDLQGSADGYARLAVSALAAGVSTSKLHTAFAGLSEGFAATGRSGDEMNRFLVQLEQGLSQGTIQMRDLRAMSQSFPAAFELAGEAAQRMGGSLQDFLKNGGLPAEQFFLTFSDIVHEKFADAAEAASQTLVGQLNILHNTLFSMKTDSTVLQPLTDAVKRLNAALADPSTASGIQDAIRGIVQFGEQAAKALATVLDHINLVIAAVKLLAAAFGAKLLSGVIASAAAAIGRIGIAMEAATVEVNTLTAATERLTLGTRAAAAASGLLSGALAFVGGPVGLAVIAVGALYLGYQKLKGAQEAASQAAIDDANKRSEAIKQMQAQNKAIDDGIRLAGQLPDLSGNISSAVAEETVAWQKNATAVLENNKAQAQALVLAGRQATIRTMARGTLLNGPLKGVQGTIDDSVYTAFNPALAGFTQAGDTQAIMAAQKASQFLSSLDASMGAATSAVGTGALVTAVGKLVDEAGAGTSKVKKFNETVQALAGLMKREIASGMSQSSAVAEYLKGVDAATKIRDASTKSSAGAQQLSEAEKLIQSIKERTQAQALLKAEMEASNGDVSKLTAGQKLLIKFNTELGTTYKGTSAKLAEYVQRQLDSLINSEKQTEAAKKHAQAMKAVQSLEASLAKTRAANKGQLESQVKAFGQPDTFANQRQRALDAAQTRAAAQLDSVALSPKYPTLDSVQQAQAAIDASTQKTLKDINVAYDEMNQERMSWLEGVKNGFAIFGDSATNIAGGVSTAFTNLADGVAGSFADLAVSGKASFGQLATSFAKAIEEMIIKFLIFKAISGIASFFTPGAAALPSSAAINFGSGQASGLFAMPQYATGGIVPGSGNSDSVPAMLTPGEGVFTRAQMARLAPASRRSGDISLSITYQEQPGKTQSERRQDQGDFTRQIKNMVQSIMSEDVATNGPVSRSYQGAFGLRRAAAAG